MLTIFYCPCCRKKIEEIGRFLEMFFEDICASYFSGKIFHVRKIFDKDGGLLTMIHFLESKGLVVSTEIDKEDILVRPNRFVLSSIKGFKVSCLCLSD